MYLCRCLKDRDITIITTSHKSPIDLFICDEHYYREYGIEIKTILNGDRKLHLSREAINRKNREAREWGISPKKRLIVIVKLNYDLSLKEIVYSVGFKSNSISNFKDISHLISRIGDMDER